MGPVPLVPLALVLVGGIGIGIALNRQQREQTEFMRREQQRAAGDLGRIPANDPRNYAQARAQYFEHFLNRLETYQWKSKIDKSYNTLYHMIVSRNSAGKSTLLNQVFNRQLATGVGHTTRQVTCIGQYTNQTSQYRLKMFDTPGFNDQFTEYNPQMLVLMRDMDKLFICYKRSLKEIEDLLKILKRIKLNKSSIVLIRTQCDQFDHVGLKKTLDQELQTDKQYLKKEIRLQCQIFAHSSRKGQSFRDNRKVANLLKSII